MDKKKKYTVNISRNPFSKERAEIVNLLMDMADKGAETEELRRVSVYSSELVEIMDMYQKLRQCRSDNAIDDLMAKYKIR